MTKNQTDDVRSECKIRDANPRANKQAKRAVSAIVRKRGGVA